MTGRDWIWLGMLLVIILALFPVFQGPEPGFILTDDGKWFAADRGTAFVLPDGWVSVGTPSDPRFRSEDAPGELRVGASCSVLDLDRMSYEEVFGSIETEDVNIERERIDIGSRRGMREREFEQGLQIRDRFSIETGKEGLGSDCVVHFEFTEQRGPTGAADMALESLDLDARRSSLGLQVLLFSIAARLWLSWKWYVKRSPRAASGPSGEGPDLR